MIHLKDSLSFLEEKKDYEVDIIFSDPPYGLGSEVIIRPDGKPDYSKASDFMNKWDMPTGDYWEKWFVEAYRTLKYGGYCVMYGMDRQLLLPKYYASLAGFHERQSLYWYFCSSFPKSADLSKMLDKNAGAEREVVGEKKTNTKMQGNNYAGDKEDEHGGIVQITTASTSLAKKYNGYKYSCAPLKQCNEAIMVFQKPYKTGSCLHDTLAYENGDTECCCGALDIEGGRVGFENGETKNDINRGVVKQGALNALNTYSGGIFKNNPSDSGRYPAQTFVDEKSAEVLDRQSGVLKTGRVAKKAESINSEYAFSRSMKTITKERPASSGGCSKILHKCPFEEEEHDLYLYKSKVSKAERNAGCEGMEKKSNYEHDGRSGQNNSKQRPDGSELKPVLCFNNHPCCKPISLNERILKLFKTPNPQKILFPFAGAGSEIIGGIRAGFTDWEGCELSEEYIKIAEARIKHWSSKPKQEKLV